MKKVPISRIFLIGLAFFACFVLPEEITGAEGLALKTNVTSVLMGRSIKVTAYLDLKSENSAKNYLLLPYVNYHRWGAQQHLDSNGRSTFLIPLPNSGVVHVQVIAVKAEPNNWMGTSDPNLLMVGRLLPINEVLRSNEIDIRVQKRQMPKLPNDGHLYCIQYENWFGDSSWETAEAVPLIGFYDSYDEDVIRQHILWFIDMGINSIMLDWSNHIWGDSHWDQRGEGARTIVNNTTIFLKVLAKMRKEGIEVPKVVLMPGLSNGPPATMEALNEELYWIYQNYILNPRFKGLFQVYNGKPLMIILDTGAIGNKKGTAESAFRVPFFQESLSLSETNLDNFRKAQGPIDDTHFTIRFMSSQNQLTKHNDLGYWSWMDGQLKPIVTYLNEKPEAVTVTPSFFGKNGWTAPEAYGRHNGTTYIETFKVALENKPRVIFLHQFNEFTGQKNAQGLGKDKNIYLDEYSDELSDDIEPVSLTSCGYRNNYGDWGFYYLNLTHALMDIFRGVRKESTLLSVDYMVISKSEINLHWSVAGVAPKDFTVAIDGKAILKEITETSCKVSVNGLKLGKHTITVIANGVSTRYQLSDNTFDIPTITPLPVSVSHTLTLN
jgi:hypothetical protein